MIPTSMEMAFMAYRALFHSSLLLVFLTGCTKPKKTKQFIPDVYVEAGISSLKQHEGFLYYNNKKFSGHTYQLYANGDTALLFSYLDGKEEGWCKKWYEKKARLEERFFAGGKKEGTHIGWWADGKPKFEIYFSNDEQHGKAKEWFDNGKPFRVFHYKKGHEEGQQKMWWEDGKVRANYVVKDGQQYGLIGRKLCKNYTDEK